MVELNRESAITGILVVLMLLTGTINTIATKYQDIQCVKYNEKNECVQRFEHFAVQSAEMFMGEMLCLIPAFFAFVYRCCAPSQGEKTGPNMRERARAVLSFAVPAMCDVSGTTLLNVGIFFTYPSVYQMLRGTVVFFAGMFTYSLLGRRLTTAQWFSLVLIVFGAGIVGAVSVIHFGKGGGHADADATDPLLGNILVVSAQIAAAFQFIVEEKYLSQYGVQPHIAVGLEGVWGFLACMVILPIMQQIKNSEGRPFDDLPIAIEQIKASRPLLIATLGSIFSIAFFNSFGITLTKRLSGASRATIDACRTLFVWMYSIHVGWEEKGLIKIILQVVGFFVLISGTSMFNGIIKGPGDKKRKKKRELTLPNLSEDMAAPLLPSDLGTLRKSGGTSGRDPQGGMRAAGRILSSTMARSFRLGRSLFTSGFMSPGGSRASSISNTPVQTPRSPYNRNGAMAFGRANGSASEIPLPSSYESKVVLIDNNDGIDESFSSDNGGPSSMARGSEIKRIPSNGDMEEPFE